MYFGGSTEPPVGVPLARGGPPSPKEGSVSPYEDLPFTGAHATCYTSSPLRSSFPLAAAALGEQDNESCATAQVVTPEY